MAASIATSRVLVTGATRGLGRELVRALLTSDCEVVAVCRDSTGARELGRSSLDGGQADRLMTIVADLSDADAADVIDQQLSSVNRLDGLINCAGINRLAGVQRQEATRGLDDLEPRAVQRMFQVNATTPLMLMAALAPRLAPSSRPRVLNLTSSRAAPQPGEGGKYGYRASKAALNIYTRCAAADLAKRGVIVVGVDPGWVRTGMGGDDAPQAADATAAAIVQLFDRLKPEDSGRLFEWTGAELVW